MKEITNSEADLLKDITQWIVEENMEIEFLKWLNGDDSNVLRYKDKLCDNLKRLQNQLS